MSRLAREIMHAVTQARFMSIASLQLDADEIEATIDELIELHRPHCPCATMRAWAGEVAEHLREFADGEQRVPVFELLDLGGGAEE